MNTVHGKRRQAEQSHANTESQSSRRVFLQESAAAAGALLLPHAVGAAEQSLPPSVVHAPLVVVTELVSTDLDPRGPTWCYIAEVLHRAGLFFEQVTPAQIPALAALSTPIVILAGNLPLSLQQRTALTQLVQQGGMLIGLGGTSGLDETFGIEGKRRLAEGWLKVRAAEHPITARLPDALHVFGGYVATSGPATVLADIQSGAQGAKGHAILEHQCGKGHAILLAPDLLFSIVQIQQGVPVLQDGQPAPDGTAELNDGELKAEDGRVLDWSRDRSIMKPDNEPAFLEPISDRLREIILRCVFYAAGRQGTRLGLLWYWPRDLKAVGHISHDSDGNDPQRAVALLEVLNRCQVKTTWCILYPGGYPRAFYGRLQDQGYELALHYDARTGGATTCWSKANLVLQHQWLLKTAGLKQITTNKNHYTRWEGRLDFYRWCQDVGIHVDQTRGPSKKGTIGFPLGGSQPYFPIDDEIRLGRFIDVMEINLLTQDLVVVCPRQYGKQLLDAVLPNHGVAHFLFHPAHIQKPHVADAFTELVDAGRAKGLQWWTSAQIHRWETARRAVKPTFDGTHQLRLHAATAVRRATLLFLRPDGQPGSVQIDGGRVKTSDWELYGFAFDGITTDISGSIRVQTAAHNA